MQQKDVNFQIFEVLLKAPTKRYITKLFEYCFSIRNKLKCLDESLQTPISVQFAENLTLTEDQAHELITQTNKLIDKCLENQFDMIDSLFPENFNAQLKKLLIEQIQLKQTSNQIQRESILICFCLDLQNSAHNEINQANHLIDFDWRLDLQLANTNSENCKIPTVFFEMDTINSEDSTRKNISFQMNQQEVNNFYNNLKKIKDQLTQLLQE